jgi:hypothetical protein
MFLGLNQELFSKASLEHGMSDALPLDLLSDEELVSAHLGGRH